MLKCGRKASRVNVRNALDVFKTMRPELRIWNSFKVIFKIFKSLDAEHRTQFTRHLCPCQKILNHLSIIIGILKWVSSIPNSHNFPFKSAFTETHLPTMTYIVKSILAVSLLLSVQDKVWRPCSNVTLSQLPSEFTSIVGEN